MNYLLFTVYLIVFCWLLLRIPFIRKSGISSRVVVALFILKIVAGITIGWIAIHIYGPGNDYWDVNDEAWNEYQILITNPGKYFTNIFTSDYPGGYSGIFSSFDSYWNDLKGNIIIKLVSVFDIFSRGDYYINSLFFNFLVFIGHVALYRLFIKIFPGKETWVIIGCFLLPSTLYFSSGIHKDGMVFLLMAILLYYVYVWLHQDQLSKKRLVFIMISLLLLFLIRHFIFIALVPAMTAWIISVKFKKPTLITFVFVYLATGILFFSINSLVRKIDPLEIIIQKQTGYLKLSTSETQINLSPLSPNFKSFASNAPESINHLLLRPYLWELPVKSLLPLNIELAIYQLLFLFFFFVRRKEENISTTSFLYFALFFTLTVFLLIGYIVPNLGSIVRYRSLYLPLVITPLICLIDWQRITGCFKISK